MENATAAGSATSCTCVSHPRSLFRLSVPVSVWNGVSTHHRRLVLVGGSQVTVATAVPALAGKVEMKARIGGPGSDELI